MAEVWFVKDGPEPTRGGRDYNLPLASCVEKLGLEKAQWLRGSEGKGPRFGDQASPVAGVAAPRHVVCKVDESEAAELGWDAGYYLLDLTPQQVKEKLASANA